jgi:MFS transporter, DHA1 family, inner membrane transport protein
LPPESQLRQSQNNRAPNFNLRATVDMNSSPSATPWPTYWALLLGNFVIGVGVLMPAGMLNELSEAFAQDAAATATLIGYGAAVLCIEAPLLAFFTNRIDRRVLLTGSLVVYSVGHLASAFAPDFTTLMIARLLMIGGAAVFTPQAASAIGLFVPPERRVSAVAFIFLGWSVAVAVGVPLAALLCAYTSWSTVYLIMAAVCAAAAMGVFATLPGKLNAPRMSLVAWGRVVTNRKILLVLCVTMIFVAGQFTVYPYLAAELKSRFAAPPTVISTLFAAYGIAGLIGSVVSAGLIGKMGAPKTVNAHLSLVVIGLLLWSVSGNMLAIAVLGLMAWGYGGGPSISGQQARLIMADPEAATASVALNTSVLYAGQAVGTYTGGLLLNGQGVHLNGWVGMSFVIVALTVSLAVRRWFRA